MRTETKPPEWERLNDIADVQQDAREQGSKRDAVAHIAKHYPHLRPNWIARHLDMLLALDPIQFAAVLHKDPTGEQAVRHVMREAA